MKLENLTHHNYFVKSAWKILNEIGAYYTYEGMEEHVLQDNYMLYIKNKKIGKWNLGIWAVGEWNIKSSYELDGETTVYKDGYGVDIYKPLTICIFLVHDWTFDKFRPSYSDWRVVVDYEDENALDKAIKELKNIVKNPIDSYYDIVDYNNYDERHRESNKYVSYIKGYYKNVIAPFVERKHRFITGFLCTKLLYLMSLVDKRIFHFEYNYRKSEWNPEFDIAMVFNLGETEKDDWKVYNFYNKLQERLRKMCNYNIRINFNYMDEENGGLPDNIWRGIYWENEPD